MHSSAVPSRLSGEHIARDKPDPVGITCMTVEYPMAARIATQVKARLNVPVMLGGAHVNAVTSQALESASTSTSAAWARASTWCTN